MTLTIQSLVKAGVIVFVIIFIYVTLANYVIEWIKKLRGKKKPPYDLDNIKKKGKNEINFMDKEKCSTQSL